MKKLETVKWASEITGVPEPQIYNLIRNEIFPAVRIGRQIRVDPDKVQAWIEAGGQAYPGGWKKTAVAQ